MSIDRTAISAQLVEDLIKYLAHLRDAYDYKITLHQIEKVACRSWPQLLAYNFHECAVCREVKSSSSCWKRCINRQPKVRERAEISPYIGTCYAGVTEAVFPIKDIQEQCVGFLCVSGYTQDRQISIERASAAATRYGLPPEKLRVAVEKLDEYLPDLNILSTQIAPVQTMLRMLFYFNHCLESRRVFNSPREKLYDGLLNYVNDLFREPNLSLMDAAEHFNISYSYASHLFAEFNSLSFARYVRHIRIEAAKRYLEHTTLAVIFTSCACGFSDSNYFSSVFKKETGITPSEYREKYARVQREVS